MAFWNFGNWFGRRFLGGTRVCCSMFEATKNATCPDGKVKGFWGPRNVKQAAWSVRLLEGGFFTKPFPIPSMYGIFTYISWIYICIYGKCRCSKYTIHGWYGLEKNMLEVKIGSNFPRGENLTNMDSPFDRRIAVAGTARNHHPVLDVLTKTYRNLGNKPPNRWPVMKGLEVLLFKKLL